MVVGRAWRLGWQTSDRDDLAVCHLEFFRGLVFIERGVRFLSRISWTPPAEHFGPVALERGFEGAKVALHQLFARRATAGRYDGQSIIGAAVPA
jgi:hypothetical protein